MIKPPEIETFIRREIGPLKNIYTAADTLALEELSKEVEVLLGSSIRIIRNSGKQPNDGVSCGFMFSLSKHPPLDDNIRKKLSALISSAKKRCSTLAVFERVLLDAGATYRARVVMLRHASNLKEAAVLGKKFFAKQPNVGNYTLDDIGKLIGGWGSEKKDIVLIELRKKWRSATIEDASRILDALKATQSPTQAAPGSAPSGRPAS